MHPSYLNCQRFGAAPAEGCALSSAAASAGELASPSGSLEGVHGPPPVNVSLDLAHGANGTEDGDHVVITKRSRDAVSGSVQSPHGHRRSTQTTLIHVSRHLTAKASEAKGSAEADSAVTEAITQAGLPVGILGSTDKSRLSHDDCGCLSHLQCEVSTDRVVPRLEQKGACGLGLSLRTNGEALRKGEVISPVEGGVGVGCSPKSKVLC